MVPIVPRSKESQVSQLAKFFPDSAPVRIPVRLTYAGSGGPLSEQTVIEFGTPR